MGLFQLSSLKRSKYLKYATLTFGIFLVLIQIQTTIKLRTEYIQTTSIQNVTENFKSLEQKTKVIKDFDNNPLIHPHPTVKALSYEQGFEYPLYIDLPGIVNKIIANPSYEVDVRPINPHPYKYIHKPKTCQSLQTDKRKNGTKPILFLVKSFVGNIALRNSIRQTWAGNRNVKNYQVLFMLGYNQTYQKRIDEEFNKYGDIVQEDFPDSYRNNILKMIMTFNWAVDFCKNAEFLFFADDDFYIKIEEAVKYLRYKIKLSQFVIGASSTGGRPYRDKKHRWYVTFEDYPYDKYPLYLGGGAYVVTHHYAKMIKIAFPYVKAIPVDDAYLGIVAKKLEIKPRNNPYFLGGTAGFATECTHNALEYLHGNCTILKKYVHIFDKPHKESKHLAFLSIFTLFIFSIIIMSIIFMLYVIYS